MAPFAFKRAGWGLVAAMRRNRALGRGRSLRALALAAAVLLVAPGADRAQAQGLSVVDNPVLLELYTAQGCASCPPADDMMLDLATREDVVALALHVDYWDYIGWVDSFADPEYSERQKRYARRHGLSTIYTPQVVINGTEILEGFRVMQVMDSIEAQRARVPEVRIDLVRGADGSLQILALPLAETAPAVALASRRVAIPGVAASAVIGGVDLGQAPATSGLAAAAAEPAPVATAAPVAEGLVSTQPMALPVIRNEPYVVQLVRYRPNDAVEIQGGENAGRTAAYANIVTSWQVIASWDMAGPLEIAVPVDGDDPIVVIVQETGQGEVIATARLR